ncbi:MAG: M23 family metallopeptidase [candidate division WOR-3 bacterium]
MERLQVFINLSRRNRFLRLSIPLRTIYLLTAVLTGFILFGGIITGSAVSRLGEATQFGRLIAENRLLREQLQVATAAIDSFRAFLSLAEQLDNRVRSCMNLRIIPSDVRLMGIGGSDTKSPLPAADQLLRRLDLNERSLAEIDAALTTRQERLSRTPSIWPVRGHIISGFGYRSDPFTGRREMHYGLDIAAPAGTPIVAPADGRVVSSGWQAGMGRCIEIDHGFGIRTIFGHCRSLNVTTGATVRRGQIIATVGSSGRATGTHLHYGVQVNGTWVNPGNYIISPLGN